MAEGLVHATGADAGSASAPAALKGLQEIALPAPPSWLPQTWGWVVIAALVLALIAWVAWRVWRHHRANRYRREALAELGRIEQALTARGEDGESRAQALVALPALVKRTALAAAPRAQVAALSDVQWLAFLDQTLPGKAFSEGAGRMLPALAYDPRPPSADATQALVALVRRWIAHHHVRV